MAIRIGEYVISGELRNTRRNSVAGWIEFAPDWGVRIELAGNLKGQFAGKTIRFQIKTSAAGRIPRDELPEFVHSVADRQIGAIGDVLLRENKIPKLPGEEAYLLAKSGTPVEFDVQNVLYLEWYGPHGRVVAEIIDPEIAFVCEEQDSHPTAEPLSEPPEDAAGPSITSIDIDENGQAAIQDLSVGDRQDEPDEDPYGLFDNDLDKHIRDSLPDGNETEVRGERSWDEVIPGIDPETKAMYEQWDEIYGGEKDEPLATLFDPPITLPPVESLQTDEQAEPFLMSLIGALAMRGIAYDICEHCTPRMAYRIFIQEILPEAYVHPGLPGTDIVQHYSAFEHCPQCEAEFEAEYEEHQKSRKDVTPPDEGLS